MISPSNIKKELGLEKQADGRTASGFTIIEVVLVLAIAGLIFLVVFLALPQLQRSRRDTQRRNDAGRIVSTLETYASNNNGEYPEDGTADATLNCGATVASGGSDDIGFFVENYLNEDEYCDPLGDPYELVDVDVGGVANLEVQGADTGSGPAPATTIGYAAGARCDGEQLQSGESRDFAVVMPLEQGNYCQDNR